MKIIVANHAVIRYVERVLSLRIISTMLKKRSESEIIKYIQKSLKLNVRDLRQEIVTKNIRAQINFFKGTGRFPDKKFKVVVENYTIVTVI